METLLLTRKQAADVLNISTDTLDRIKNNGDIECLYIGSRVYYSPDVLKAFVSQKGIIPTIGG